MLKKKEYKFWFCTGSQDLYGDECLAHVAEHAKIIVEKLNESGVLPYEVVWKPTLITNELIRKTFNEANIDDECAGVITWMHTFSPAKSWILGLQEFRKPLLHLHTQFNMEIPYHKTWNREKSCCWTLVRREGSGEDRFLDAYSSWCDRKQPCTCHESCRQHEKCCCY